MSEAILSLSANVWTVIFSEPSRIAAIAASSRTLQIPNGHPFCQGEDALPDFWITKVRSNWERENRPERLEKLCKSRIVTPLWEFKSSKAIGELLIRCQSLGGLMCTHTHDRQVQIIGKESERVEEQSLLPEMRRPAWNESRL